MLKGSVKQVVIRIRTVNTNYDAKAASEGMKTVMPTVIYEVRLTIDPSIRAAFLSWLDEHVAEMLTFDGFVAAQILTGDTGTQCVSVHYTQTVALSCAIRANPCRPNASRGAELFPTGLLQRVGSGI